MPTLSKRLDALRVMVRDAKRVVFFTGAGISTESGVPDFRSPGGLWSRYKPILFQDFLASRDSRRDDWRRTFVLQDAFADVKPNRGHYAIAHLMASGKAYAVVTQNIDGLHQAAGAPSENVIELHGTARHASCLSCGRLYDLPSVRARFESSGEPPDCGVCGGPIKVAIIAFGQPMPEEAMLRAEEETRAADLFIVVGSSLVVYPAAAFPLFAKKNGASLVIVNREPTDLDEYADLVLHAEAGEALEIFLPSG